MRTFQNKKTFWLLALLFVSIIWGTSFLVIKHILLDVSPFSYLSLRFGIAFLIMLLLYYKKLRHPGDLFSWEGLISGVLLSGVYILSSIGVEYTSASNATFITNLFMIFTPFIEVVFAKHKLQRKYLYASFLGILGFFFISGLSDLVFNVGDGLMLLSAVFLSIHFVCTENFTQRRSPENLVTTEAGVVFITALIIGTLHGSLALPSNIDTYLPIAYLAIFSTILAFEIIAQAEKYIESTQTAIIISLQGVWALLFALSLQLEVLTIHKIIGVIIMTAAILVAEASIKKTPI
ncbi:MAG: DMT family transporter [Candidatus Gracilibacteria bacterium]